MAATKQDSEKTTGEVKTEVVKAEENGKGWKLLTVDVEIIGEDGETKTEKLSFKPLNLVPLGILRKTRRNSTEQMWAIFEWALDADGLDILDQVSSDKLDETLIAMQKASSVDLGESTAS